MGLAECCADTDVEVHDIFLQMNERRIISCLTLGRRNSGVRWFPRVNSCSGWMVGRRDCIEAQS